MTRFIDHIVSWQKYRRLTAARKTAARWMQESAKVMDQISRDSIKLEELRLEVQSLSDQIAVDVKRASNLVERQREALEALQEENRILSESTIPTLVASHKLLLERYDAEVAIAVRQRVVTSASEG
jgi:predicted  nucleic acid-binding Zn-ribbon protein